MGRVGHRTSWCGIWHQKTRWRRPCGGSIGLHWKPSNRAQYTPQWFPGLQQQQQLRSLAPQRSALLCSLCYARIAMIALFAHSLHSQARSLTLLTPSRTVKFIDVCSCCKRVQRPTSIERLGRGQWSVPCGLSSEYGHSQFYRCFSAPKNYLNNVKNLLQFKSTAYKKAKHNFPMKSCQTCF